MELDIFLKEFSEFSGSKGRFYLQCTRWAPAASASRSYGNSWRR